MTAVMYYNGFSDIPTVARLKVVDMPRKAAPFDLDDAIEESLKEKIAARGEKDIEKIDNEGVYK